MWYEIMFISCIMSLHINGMPFRCGGLAGWLDSKMKLLTVKSVSLESRLFSYSYTYVNEEPNIMVSVYNIFIYNKYIKS